MAEPKQPYISPTLTEWGTVVDLTRGLGRTRFTDESQCVNPGGVVFEGSAPGACRPI